MAKIMIYSKTYCPYCDRAKALFDGKGVKYEEKILDTSGDEFAALKKKTGMMTVPQIFINDQLVGGYSELSALERDGKLDALLA